MKKRELHKLYLCVVHGVPDKGKVLNMLSLFWHSPLSFNAPPHHTWLILPSSGLSLNIPQSQHVAYFLHCA